MKKILTKSIWLSTYILICAIAFLPSMSAFAAANAASSAAGNSHSLILKNDGTVWGWGNNLYGQVGDGTLAQRGVPVQVKDLKDVIRISAGNDHSLALKSDGTVWAWGSNGYGQLGNGTSNNSSTPVQISGLTGVVSIGGGAYHSIALKSDGTVWGWGRGDYGQIGNGTTSAAQKPTQVYGLTDVIAIAAGGYFNLAVKKDGTVWAWGAGGSYQLGIGTNTSNQLYPVKVANLANIIGVAAMQNNSYALDVDGKVYAWGNNHGGNPTQFGGLTDIVEIASGSSANHALALKKDGSVYTWGVNSFGQLGTGNTTNNWTPTPQLITNIQK